MGEQIQLGADGWCPDTGPNRDAVGYAGDRCRLTVPGRGGGGAISHGVHVTVVRLRATGNWFPIEIIDDSVRRSRRSIAALRKAYGLHLTPRLNCGKRGA